MPNNMSLPRALEALLFVASKPISFTQFLELTQASKEELDSALEELKERFSRSGIRLLVHEQTYQFVTAPEEAECVKQLAKQEITGELTRPSLETLTIIAYKGPITQPEIEQIRGVQCTQILRNLLLRGLIEVTQDAQRLGEVYVVSNTFLRHLGVMNIEELPEYDVLHTNEDLETLMQQVTEEV